jgi:hypothetical protein
MNEEYWVILHIRIVVKAQGILTYQCLGRGASYGYGGISGDWGSPDDCLVVVVRMGHFSSSIFFFSDLILVFLAHSNNGEVRARGRSRFVDIEESGPFGSRWG